MLSRVASVLAVTYAPTMWFLVGIHVFLGLAGVFSPRFLRRVFSLFVRNTPVRVLGVGLLIVGAQMFLRAPGTMAPLLVKTLGTLLFIDGGVRLFIPALSVIYTERLVAQSHSWFRLIALLFLLLAYLFFKAALVPVVPPAA